MAFLVALFQIATRFLLAIFGVNCSNCPAPSSEWAPLTIRRPTVKRRYSIGPWSNTFVRMFIRTPPICFVFYPWPNGLTIWPSTLGRACYHLRWSMANPRRRSSNTCRALLPSRLLITFWLLGRPCMSLSNVAFARSRSQWSSRRTNIVGIFPLLLVIGFTSASGHIVKPRWPLHIASWVNVSTSPLKWSNVLGRWHTSYFCPSLRASILSFIFPSSNSTRGPYQRFRRLFRVSPRIITLSLHHFTFWTGNLIILSHRQSHRRSFSGKALLRKNPHGSVGTSSVVSTTLRTRLLLGMGVLIAMLG